MDLKNLSNSVFSINSKFYILGFSLLILAGILNSYISKPIIELSKQETALNFNKNLLIYGSAGNKRLLTDLLWVQTLIESDLEHYKKRDLNSWLFLRFNTIATLDPRFYENYLFGGQFLAIVKDDLEGAEYIYDKGLKEFPDDYRLTYNAGFLNYFEMGNFEKGLKLLEKVMNHPSSPFFIKSIIHKLKVATGTKLEEVFGLVLHNYENTTDENLKKKLKADLYAIKAEIDLKCLNYSKERCELIDLEGSPYVKKGEKYYSARKFRPFRINKRGETKSPHLKEVNTF